MALTQPLDVVRFLLIQGFDHAVRVSDSEVEVDLLREILVLTAKPLPATATESQSR